MDSTYRPQSPDLSAYVPQSPDLSGLRPQSPDLSGIGPSHQFGIFNQQHQGSRFETAYGSQAFPGSIGYSPPTLAQPPPCMPQQFQATPMAQQNFKNEFDDDDYIPTQSSSKRARKMKQEPMSFAMNGQLGLPAASPHVKSEHSDPTLGCQLKTSFPVARIKRIMQADEDIGKVAQVTPTVVSRALELFMIKLISNSAHQARGGRSTSSADTAGISKGPRRVLAQHLKKAVMSDDTFDFLHEIVNKVPDAPTKAKKEPGSDSDDGEKPKRRGRRRKDSE